MQEAVLYTLNPDQSVTCGVCPRRCRIPLSGKGFCQSRQNIKGKLYSLIYGLVSNGVQIDPIEKKPMYHFHPGTQVASVGSLFCNFRCRQCLNWWTTWGAGESQKTILGPSKREISPIELVGLVVKSGFPGLAFTYNEPTIWLEYVHDAAQLAKEKGLYTVFVTNGYITPEALDYIGPYIEAYAVDFKGFSDATYQRMNSAPTLAPIPEMTKRAQEKWGMKVEVTTLLIPTINDDLTELRQMAQWIQENLGPNTPWHLSSFNPELAPDPDFKKIPPPPSVLAKKVKRIGQEEGLNFVYIWFVDLVNHLIDADTICPQCQTLNIHRAGYHTEILALDSQGHCSQCDFDLGVVLSHSRG